MKQPRGIDFFSCEDKKKGAVGISRAERSTGDMISAVPSRLAFHNNGEILVGGNASGRVVVVDTTR
jgi:hypothetical protein